MRLEKAHSGSHSHSPPPPPPSTTTTPATKVTITDLAPVDVEEWNYDNVKEFLSAKYRLETEEITIIKNQKVDGRTLLKMTDIMLERCGLAVGIAVRIVTLVQELKKEKGLSDLSK